MLTVTQSYLTEMVRRLVNDPATTIGVRNECHRLLMAIERNHLALIEESVDRLARLTAKTDDSSLTTVSRPT
jgi:hypothetical protein